MTIYDQKTINFAKKQEKKVKKFNYRYYKHFNDSRKK